MNLTKNQIEILNLLISSKNYISSYEISSATGINRRLVREEMIEIKKICNSLGYELVSKTSKGYLLQGKDSKSLLELSHYLEEASQKRESLFPTFPEERRNYVITRLLESDGYLKIDDLADELLISRSTISSDIKAIRSGIKKYHLVIKQKPNYGICITGDEVNKRKALCDYLFRTLQQSEMFYDYLQSYLTDSDSLEYNIIKIIKKHHIEMSDLSLVDFLLRLSITMMRILNNHIITFSPNLEIIEGRSEFKCAEDIAKTISKEIKRQINEHEINNMTIQLICLRSSKGVSINVYAKHDKYDIQDLIKQIFDEIYKQTLIRFDDKHFNYTFQHYVESSLIRLYYNEKVRTPIYNTIQSSYPLAYELAQITSNVIYEYEHKYITSSEIAFFAILFQDAITKQRTPKKKVLLLTGLGGGHATLCRNLLLEHFENKIDIVKTFQYYKLEDEDLSQYDFIISTTSIHQQLAIPYINISQIITDNDYNKIEKYLTYTFDHYRLETLFHPKLFSSNIEAHRKSDVVNEIYRLLNMQYPTIKELFVKTLSSKNNVSITYYANNIALLKLKKPLNSNNIVVVVILQEPMFFIDHEVQCFILFSGIDQNRFLVNTLNNSLKHLSESNDISKLYDNISYVEFLKLMIKHQN